MTLHRITCAVLAAVLLGIGCAAYAVSPADYDMNAPQSLEPEHLYAESALLIDEATGETLLSKNARVRMYPASTTKIMTLLLGIGSGIDLDEMVTIPSEAADIPSGSSVIPIKPGDVMRFRDLLYGFMLSSGNDGANAVAVLTDGSVSAFVDHMNRRAAELGCEGTHFSNAHGYHSDDHFTTAQDLAVMARAAMQNDVFRQIVAAAKWDMTVTRGGRTGTGTIVSRNSLLQSDLKYYYPECTGIKTGHHSKAGWCFVGSAERNGRRVICVALNCDKEDEKWYDAARLFEYGFTRYEDVSVETLLNRAKDRFAGVQLENAAPDDAEGGWLSLNLEQLEGGAQTRPVLSDSEAAMNAALEQVAENVKIEWTRAPQAPVEAGETLGSLTCAMPDGVIVTAALTASRSVAARKGRPSATAAPREEADATPEDAGEEGAPYILSALILLLLAALAAYVTARTLRERRRAANRRARRTGR